MIDIKNQWKGVTDREAWAIHGASFVTKVKATKAVWFPPKPVETGKKAASTATKATKRTTGKATGATKKATGKATGATKKATSPVRRKKT
jgi:hypothetical protein